MSPTRRSLAHLHELGSQARVVEKWNPFAQVRHDLFGGDLLALKPGEPVLVIQTTSRSNHAARRKKLAASGFVRLWYQAGAVMELWSWAKQGPRGQRKTWQLKREGLR